jgi:hypothetical protein
MDDAPFFDALLRNPHEPDWRPLVAVARLSRSTDAYPSIDEGEFMYVARADSRDGPLQIHLYKHVDTRRYLNLDDAGHAYRYREHIDALDDLSDEDLAGGRYVLHRTLGEALHHAVGELEWMRA